ncbi:unnamed protein product, partial [Sphacelaria rigidula]
PQSYVRLLGGISLSADPIIFIALAKTVQGRSPNPIRPAAAVTPPLYGQLTNPLRAAAIPTRPFQGRPTNKPTARRRHPCASAPPRIHSNKPLRATATPLPPLRGEPANRPAARRHDFISTPPRTGEQTCCAPSPP